MGPASIGGEVAVPALCFVAGAAVTLAVVGQDVRSHRLSNRGVGLLAGIALLGLGGAGVSHGWGHLRLLPMILGAACFAAPWLVLRLVSRRGVGLGDVKLAAALGLYIGWLDPALTLTAVAATSVAFAASMGWSRLMKRRRTVEGTAFGPALAAGAMVASAAGWW